MLIELPYFICIINQTILSIPLSRTGFAIEDNSGSVHRVERWKMSLQGFPLHNICDAIFAASFFEKRVPPQSQINMPVFSPISLSRDQILIRLYGRGRRPAVSTISGTRLSHSMAIRCIPATPSISCNRFICSTQIFIPSAALSSTFESRSR